MDTVIYLDVPDWQIGQDVTIYFPDTMLKHGKCEMIKEQNIRRDGRWKSIPHKKARVCSVCEKDEPYKFADDDADVYAYCPHCGAKMEGR